ncbi:MAG TPA: hypothetical protein PK388_09325, partial [Kiritimatiellia bacterium]|nr:hypothetical protein [Kiritimatiellia bacterium]
KLFSLLPKRLIHFACNSPDIFIASVDSVRKNQAVAKKSRLRMEARRKERGGAGKTSGGAEDLILGEGGGSMAAA